MAMRNSKCAHKLVVMLNWQHNSAVARMGVGITHSDLSRPVMRPRSCGKFRMFAAIATVSNHDDPLLHMKQ
jgi:hypothetical protein